LIKSIKEDVIMALPKDKSKAFEAGVLTRANGYTRDFNPFHRKHTLYRQWLKGWLNQNNLMTAS
jgi:ribosome modulation factor